MAKTSSAKSASLVCPPLTQLRDTAQRAAHEAGRVLMKRFRTKLRINQKEDFGLVTNADLEAERVALRILKSAFPHFGILAEESPAQEGKSLGRWILDPLDGTTNYAHGLTTFCVSIAAEWDGKIVAGVIFAPALGDTYSAILGKGAMVNGRRISVSSTENLNDAMLSTGFSSRKDQWLAQELITFERMSRKANAVRRPGSAALDLAHVARGIFDGFWERGLAPWDIAAGSLLVQEAGGSATDFKGSPLALMGDEILCSNSRIHSSLIRELKAEKKVSTPKRATKRPAGIYATQ